MLEGDDMQGVSAYDDVDHSLVGVDSTAVPTAV